MVVIQDFHRRQMFSTAFLYATFPAFHFIPLLWCSQNLVLTMKSSESENARDVCMCESLCMDLKWKKGSKQQIGKLKNEAQRRPNTKQMRSDLRWNDEHCRWQNYFDIERMNSGMLDMVPNNVFKFYSIHLSFRQNFVHTQRMEERANASKKETITTIFGCFHWKTIDYETLLHNMAMFQEIS